MTWYYIYIWTRLGVIDGFVNCTLVVSLFVYLLYGISTIFTFDEDMLNSLVYKKLKSFAGFITKFFIAALIVFAIVPSKKDAAMMFVVPKLASVETFSKVTSETQDIVVTGLEVLNKTLQDLKGDKDVQKETSEKH